MSRQGTFSSCPEDSPPGRLQMSPSLHPSGLTLDFMVPKNVHFELTPWLDIGL